MTMPQNALTIENVSISYPPVTVVKDVSLQIRAGEVFGLIGLNGVGKTTLIKTILKLRSQDQGRISIFDENHENKESRRHVAYLPERFDPPWFLNGMEFIKFSLRIYNISVSEEQIFMSADSLALDKAALRRRVQTYSKGMRQKLGLIATFLTGCNLLILDEPMSGLDPQARNLVKKMILGEKEKNSARTVFFSSHILADMDEICDRVAVLHGGRMQYTGTAKELKQKMGHENLEQSFLSLIEKRMAA